jgi:hypothetical protein
VERIETGLSTDEQEEEKSKTEHKENGIAVNEINKRSGLQKRINQSIPDRMNGRAEILMRINRLMANANTRKRRFEVGLSDKEESSMINDLKRSLETFKRDEIPPRRCAKVMLEDPTLLPLAQQRTFRISRRDFYLPNSRLPSP